MLRQLYQIILCFVCPVLEERRGMCQTFWIPASAISLCHSNRGTQGDLSYCELSNAAVLPPQGRGAYKSLCGI